MIPGNPEVINNNNPLMSRIEIIHPKGKSETLEYCAHNLLLLADLVENENRVLNAKTRLAMWRQLTAIAQIMEAISAEISNPL